MIIFAVNSISTTSSCKKQAEICSILLIEEISCRISYIELWIASRKGSLFIFLVFSANVFTIPEVVLLISLFISIIICQTFLYLFSSWFLISLRKFQILGLLLLCKLLWNIFVQIQLRLTFWSKCSQILLDSNMKLLRQLPYGLPSFRIKVIVSFIFFIIKYLIRFYKFIYLLGIHFV